MIKVLSQKFLGAAGLGGGENHGIPKGDLPSFGQDESVTKKLPGIVDDGPDGQVLDNATSLCGFSSLAKEIDIKLLQDLNTYGDTSKAVPTYFQKDGGYFTLRTSFAIVSVEKDIGVQEAFSGHVPRRD